MKVAEALETCTLALLRRVADSHGIAAGAEVLRSELIEALRESLLAPGRVASIVAGLDEDERHALQLVAGYGWAARGYLLVRDLPRLEIPAKRKPTSSISPVLLSLLHKGLLYRDFLSLGPWRGEAYLVPDEIQSEIAVLLPAVRPPGPDVALETTVVPERVLEFNPFHDVFTLLSFLASGERRFQQGDLARSDAARLAREAASFREVVPRGWPENRWRFLIHVCLSGGWVRREKGVLKPSRTAPLLLAGGRVAVTARLVQAYLKARGWSEIEEAGRVRQILGGARADEVAGRRLLLHYLDELAPPGWTDLGGFCEALRVRDPDFLREGYSSPTWAVLDLLTGGELHGPASWDPVEGEWVRYLLRGPLLWLGLVRWGLTMDGRPVGFQRLAHREPAVDEAARTGGAAPLLVEEDFRVSATQDADLAQLLRLERYLELLRRGRTSEYRLSRDAALAAVEAGGSWAELRSLLESMTGGLPGSVASAVVAWSEDYARFALEGGVMLIVASESDASTMSGLAGAAGCIEGRLGVRSFRVRPERLWELVSLLRDAGHLPRVDAAARALAARAAGLEVEVAREAYFALLLAHALHWDTERPRAALALARLEEALGPEDAEAVGRSARDAARRVGGPQAGTRRRE